MFFWDALPDYQELIAVGDVVGTILPCARLLRSVPVHDRRWILLPARDRIVDRQWRYKWLRVFAVVSEQKYWELRPLFPVGTNELVNASCE